MVRAALLIPLFLVWTTTVATYDWDGDVPIVWSSYDDRYNTIVHNESVDVWLSLFNNATHASSGIMDLAFRLEELDLFRYLGVLMDSIFGNMTTTTQDGGLLPLNATDEDGSQWAMVSVVALMPLRCEDVDRAVAAFNAAVQAANPETTVSSTARRLGDQPCTPGGVCPCHRDARALALEIRSKAAAGPLILPDSRLLPFPLVRWRQASSAAPAVA